MSYDPLAKHPVSTDKRKEILEYNIRQYYSQGYKLEVKSDFDAVIYIQRRVTHVLHGLVTFFTCGLWALVWIILSMTHKDPERHAIWVDEYGDSHIRRIRS